MWNHVTKIRLSGVKAHSSGLGATYQEVDRRKIKLVSAFYRIPSFSQFVASAQKTTRSQLRLLCAGFLDIAACVWFYRTRRITDSTTRLSQSQHFVDCAGHLLQSLTFLSENKEWACDSSCIFLLMFINRRLKYLLHGGDATVFIINYLLSVFYNLVNFIYPLYVELGNTYVTWSLGFRELCFVLYRVLVSVSFSSSLMRLLNLLLGYTVVIL